MTCLHLWVGTFNTKEGDYLFPVKSRKVKVRVLKLITTTFLYAR